MVQIWYKGIESRTLRPGTALMKDTFSGWTTELVFSYFYFFTCSWAIDWNPLANRWLALCDDYSLNGLFHICQICPDAAFQNTILKRRVIEPQNKVPVFFFLSMKLHDLSAQIFSQDFEMKPVRIYRKTTDSYE